MMSQKHQARVTSDHLRFLWMQRQAHRLQLPTDKGLRRLRLFLIGREQQKIIGKAHERNILIGQRQVQFVQIQITQDGRNHRPLRDTPPHAQKALRGSTLRQP